MTKFDKRICQEGLRMAPFQGFYALNFGRFLPNVYNY